MKSIKYFFEFVFVISLFCLFKIIGLKNASNLGSILGITIGPLFRSKNLIKENIKIGLGDIDKKLRTHRLETPRVKVPKGSVGITEQFCNIYTYESPGGWNIIGNTPKNIFNKLNFDKPLLINPGDKVSFYKITKQEYLNWNE